MSTTSFSYFQGEDRMLVTMEPGHHQFWLTRRLTQSIVSDIAVLFAGKVPGEGIPGAGSRSERIAMEHRMAMDEEDLEDQSPGQPGPIQFSDNLPPLSGKESIVLCQGLDATLGVDSASVSFVCDEKTLTLKQNRPGFHRFLRTLLLCADKAEWQMQDIPQWLRQSLLGGLLSGLPPLDEHEADEC